MAKRERGTGRIYKRGNIWWIKYHWNGKPFYESSESTKKSVATETLKQRLGAISLGKNPGVKFNRTTFEELTEDLLRDYRLNKRKSIQRVEISIKHLSKHFGHMRARDIVPAEIAEYVEDRLDSDKEPKPATINRELAALRRMLELGRKSEKVDRVPYIEILKENNVRKGFFEHDVYLSVLKALPAAVRGPVSVAYKTGWRKSEVTGLTWDRVDLQERIIRLEPGETKNDDGRNYYMDEDVYKLFSLQNLRRVQGCNFVFHRNGRQIKDFRGSWKKACKEAGCEGKLFHDLRRTGVRNMVRAGVPEVVAMMISGHKTRAVFDRYNITSDKDLKEATIKVAAFLKGKEKK